MSHDRIVAVIDLKYPVMSEGVEITKLTLRRPRGKELRKMNIAASNNLEVLYPVLAACCDVPETTIDELDFEDLSRLLNESTGFFLVMTGSIAP